MNTAPLFPDMETTESPLERRQRLQVVRIAMVKDRPILYSGERLTTASQVPDAFRTLIGDPDREYFVAFLLDGKNRIVSCNVVSVGSLNQAIVHPRETFKAAVLANAAAIIVAHNHPTGDPTPSREDLEITRRLREAGELLGIRLLDHVIVGDGCYRSFADNGLL
jgi:DNA repair protein RadC